MSKGRKRARILASLAVVGVALALIAFLVYRSFPHEPSYNGHPLSYWVAVLGQPPVTSTSSDTEREQATNAVVHIGVAATPFLVKWIQFDPPRWKRSLALRLVRTRFAPAIALAHGIIDPTLANGTEIAFTILGPRAMPAFDDLCRLFNTNSSQTAIPAARALACVGTNALPLLLTAVTNANHAAHRVALDAIRRIPDLELASQQVVPVLANYLIPTNNSSDQILAIVTLGKLNAVPEASVLALASCLKSTNSTMKIFSANTLGSFGEQATGAIPALTNAAMTDPDSYVRTVASNALNRINPQSFPSPYGH